MPKPEDQQLAELLADFTDRILTSPNQEDVMAESDLNVSDEYVKLQNAVLKMKSAVEKAHPDETVRARIRRNVMLATSQGVDPSTERMQTLRKISGIAFAGGFALVVLFGLLFFSAPDSDVSLAATAGGFSFWASFVLIVTVVVIAIIAWFNRQR